MVYTVTFNPAIDYVVRMPRLVPGALNRTEDELLQCGGKGINVSAVLTELGVENVALGFVAGFTGDALEQALRRRGMRTDFVHLADGMTRINIKIKDGRETEINARGPQIGARAMEQFCAKLDAVSDDDLLVLAGSIPAGMPSDGYDAIFAALRQKHVGVVVDASGDLLRGTLRYRPFLIKPNEHELGELFGRVLTGEQEIRRCALALQRDGARNVLVSRAARGAVLLDETGSFHTIAAPRGAVRNSVGAGDSMVAGFLAGYLHTGDYAEALRWGTAAGSATAFSDGLAQRQDVLQLLRAL